MMTIVPLGIALAGCIVGDLEEESTVSIEQRLVLREVEAEREPLGVPNWMDFDTNSPFEPGCVFSYLAEDTSCADEPDGYFTDNCVDNTLFESVGPDECSPARTASHWTVEYDCDRLCKERHGETSRGECKVERNMLCPGAEGHSDPYRVDSGYCSCSTTSDETTNDQTS